MDDDDRIHQPGDWVQIADKNGERFVVYLRSKPGFIAEVHLGPDQRGRTIIEAIAIAPETWRIKGERVQQMLEDEQNDGELLFGGERSELLESGLTAEDIRMAKVTDAFLGARVASEVMRAYRENREPSNPAPAIRNRGASLTDDELADIALHYLEALEAEPRKPIESMVHTYSAEGFQFKKETIRERVRLARAAHYLTPGRRGVPGGGEGPALSAWLKRKESQR